MVEVFDDSDEYGAQPTDDDQGANAASSSRHFAGEGYHPADRGEPRAESREERHECADSDGQGMSTPVPASPEGPPPTMTDQQRARLHQPLRERDDEWNIPFGLDRYSTDEEKWRACEGTKNHGYQRRWNAGRNSRTPLQKLARCTGKKGSDDAF